MLYSARSLDSRLMEMVLLPYKLELLGSFRVVTESPASDGDRPRPSPAPRRPQRSCRVRAHGGRRRDGRGPTQRLISEIDLGACDRTQRTSASGRVHASDERRADRRERPGEAARFEAVSEEGFLKLGSGGRPRTSTGREEG